MTSTPLILIVDDNLPMQGATARVLSQAGYRTCVADDGQAALRLARSEKPDLILLDVMLPDINGLEVCRQLKADPTLAGCFIILLSSMHIDSSRRIEGLDEGADDYIARPIPDSELLARVRGLLRLKRTEDALRASEQKFRSFFEMSSDLIVLFDETGRVCEWSPAVERLTGLTRQQVLGQTFLDLTQALAWTEEQLAYGPEASQQMMDALLAGQSPFFQRPIEIPIRTVSGERRIIEQVVFPIPSEHGYQLGVIARDVTERKQAESQRETTLKALQESAASLARSQRVGHLGSWDWDVAGNTLSWSDEIYRIWEVGRDFPLAFDSIAGMIHPDDQEMNANRVQALLASGDQDEFEFRIVCPDGTVKNIFQRLEILRAPAGRPIKIFGIMQDITVRKQLEAQQAAALAALIESERRERERAAELQTLMDAVPVAVWIAHDQMSQVITGNRTADDLHRLPPQSNVSLSAPEDQRPRHFKIYQHGVELPPNDLPIQIAAASGVEIRDFEVDLVFDDGTVVHELGHVMPLFDEQSRPRGAVAAFLDITERKEAEQALQQAKDFAENLIQTANVLFVQLGLDGKVVRLNAAAEEISGYRQAELEGRSWFETLVPNDRYPLVWPEFARITSQDKLPGIFENPILTRQGQEREILWKSKALFEDDQLVGTISFGIDITERKQVENELRESEEKWRRLFAILPVGVSTLDAQRTITELNPALEKILGIGSEGLLNGSYQQRTYLRSDGAPLAFDEFPSVRAVREQRNIEHVEIGVVKEDGATVWTDVSAAPLPYADASCVVTTTDITDRKRAESQREAALEALRASETLLRTLIDALPERIFAKDAQSRFTLANAAEIRLDGATSFDDLRGKTDFDFYPIALAQQYYTDEQLILTTGQPLIGREERNLDQETGRIRWQQTSKMPLRDVTGRITGLAGVSVDITEHKQLEEELLDLNATLEQRVADRTRRLYEANARLSELDQLKDQFISRISHELRTPLTGILSSLDLLEYGKPENRARHLQTIRDQSQRLRELIESLLEVTQKDVNAAGLHVAPTDLNQLAAALVAEITPRATQRGLTLTSTLTPQLPFASADASLLAQALSKLAANALNYTPVGGTITLSTAEVIDAGETWITFAIRDSGPGIALDEVDRIFDRFYRGRAAADYKTPGTGVGLSISRDILTSLDGRLTVDSQPGKGATFTAWLKPA